jgi:hypothetical protein
VASLDATVLSMIDCIFTKFWFSFTQENSAGVAMLTLDFAQNLFENCFRRNSFTFIRFLSGTFEPNNHSIQIQLPQLSSASEEQTCQSLFDYLIVLAFPLNVSNQSHDHALNMSDSISVRKRTLRLLLAIFAADVASNKVIIFVSSIMLTIFSCSRKQVVYQGSYWITFRSCSAPKSGVILVSCAPIFLA